MEDAQTLGFGIALILAIWAYLGIVLQLAPGVAWHEPIIAGTVTGLIIGNVEAGLYVGGALMLMSLGMHTYGGASMPDFQTGAIVGTAFTALPEVGPEAALTLAVPISILMIQLDVLARTINVVFIHGADKFVEKGQFKKMTLMHLLGQVPWGLSRAIPVFIAISLGQGPVQAFIDWSPEWLEQGMQTVGTILPVLGFALLLSMLPVKKYWPFLLIGYALLAYMEIPIIGIAIIAAAITPIYMRMKAGGANV